MEQRGGDGNIRIRKKTAALQKGVRKGTERFENLEGFECNAAWLGTVKFGLYFET